jgi:CHAT domain-containing protein
MQTDEVLLSKTATDSSLIETLKRFRKSVSKMPTPGEAAESFRQYQKDAFYLYQKLLAPIINQWPDVRELTIIPHDILNTIPFESLITEQNGAYKSYQQLPYVLQSRAISYAYSATSFFRQTPGRISSRTLAIAPSFSGETIAETNGGLVVPGIYALQNSAAGHSQAVDSVRGDLSSLAWTAEEAKEVHACYGGRLLLGEKASEAQFKQRLAENGIIHIASHALLHEDDPTLSRILFTTSNDSMEDGSLFLEEVFNMDFSNKLVCLSACNTAWDTRSNRRGLMSLARGFHYAGSPSLMGTLWQAHDRSSYIVSTNFHKQLKEGMPLNEAMQKAKLAYLNNADALKAHPYYWAHMLVIGETDLHLAIPNYQRQGLMAGAVLGFAGLFFMAIWKNRVSTKIR